MTRGTREQLLTAADQAINDYGRAVINLKFMSDTYGDIHPEHKLICDQLVALTEESARLLLEFKLERM